MRYEPIEIRFERHYIPEPMSGCWLWLSTLTSDGYGRIIDDRKRSRRQILAHRISWELHRGLIPELANVLHTCDNPGCVNPEHLFLGSHSDNMRDSVKKGRKNNLKGEKHGNAKLTEAQALEIKHSSDRGVDLAARFGVAATLISKIRSGENWKHLP